ncbi:MAG TPA: hypothetical protein VFZ60_10015 [Nitrososphaeraceae archaeon]
MVFPPLPILFNSLGNSRNNTMETEQDEKEIKKKITACNLNEHTY